MRHLAIILNVAALLAVAAAASAQAPTRPPRPARPNTKPAASVVMPVVSVNFDNAPIAAVALRLTETSGVRVLVGSGANGRATLSLQNTPLEAAVRTAATVAGLEWKLLWLSPEVAPRLRAEQAEKLARTLSGLGRGTVAMTDGDRSILFESRGGAANAPAGLRPVFILYSKVDPSAESPAASEKPAPRPEAPPVVAPTNDPDVRRVQGQFAGLSPEQQRAFFQSIRNYMRAIGGADAGNGNARPGRTDRSRGGGRRG